MDFDTLDLRNAEDEEYWLHLRHGETKLYADMDKQEGPCRVRVASPASNGVEPVMKSVQRSIGRQAALSDQLANAVNREQRRTAETRLDQAEEQTQKAVQTFLNTVILDWENIEKGGKKLTFSKEALADMTEPKAPLSRLVMTIVEDMGKLHDPFTEPDGGS
ncbi:hypothetical protein HME9302_00984 [Alteripontixanthobacter maritimus]|uniref:Uncharacterized protein n=1 Tax=Alteripontixanthobacter maritimus TaxID=2161824 RepID=A0A369QA50_9SPHN|nr:hypothetical protein [Alteripontixanthobacter maritimus]RDC59789.1 hypothetical protein HME9302_00984 [Alteripontixanthobacter maritimus]